MADVKREVATVVSGGTTSTAIKIWPGADFIGVEIPAIDDGDVTIQVAIDGTNFKDVYYDYGAGPIKYVALSSGDDPAARDISRAVCGFAGRYIRFVIGAAQSSGAVDLVVNQVLRS